jgi:hypothetical protein
LIWRKTNGGKLGFSVEDFIKKCPLFEGFKEGAFS